MLMAAALLLVVSGALPVGGTPAVYRGGLLLALAAAISLASLYAALKLSGRQWWRLALALLMAFMLVGGVSAAWMYGLEGWRFAQGGEWKWLGSLGMWCTAFFGCGMAIVGAWGMYRLLDRRLWLAALHLSLVAMGLGCFADYMGETKGMMTLPSAQNTGRMAMHEQLVDEGRAYPFGFSVGVKNFEVSYYGNGSYGLYEFAAGRWKRLALADERDGRVSFPGDVDVAVKDIKDLPGMPRPMYVIGGGRVVVKEEAPVKSYEATCVVEQGNQLTEHMVRVNEPLFCGDWIFYLLNYRDVHGVPHVQMMARRSPGRLWMLGGIGGLLLSTVFWCWMPAQQPQGEEVPA